MPSSNSNRHDMRLSSVRQSKESVVKKEPETATIHIEIQNIPNVNKLRASMQSDNLSELIFEDVPDTTPSYAKMLTTNV